MTPNHSQRVLPIEDQVLQHMSIWEPILIQTTTDPYEPQQWPSWPNNPKGALVVLIP